MTKNDFSQIRNKTFLFLLILIGIWMSSGMIVHLVRDSSKVVNWGKAGQYETSIQMTEEDSLFVFSDVEAEDFVSGAVPAEGDTVTAFNGLQATPAVRDSLLSFPKPVEYSLDVSYLHGGQELTATMNTHAVPRGQFYMMIGMHVIRFLIGFSFLIVGFTALSRQPSSAGVRALVLFTFSMAAFVLFAVGYLADYYITIFVDLPHVLGNDLGVLTTFIGAFWLNLHLLFPYKTKIMKRIPWLGYALCYVTPITATIVGFAYEGNTNTFATINMLVQLAAGFTLLGIHHANARTALEKRQTKLVLFGAVVGFSPLLLVALASIPFPDYLNDMGLEGALALLNIVLLCWLAMPISILYAFSRYGLLDIEAKLRRGTRHLLITGAVLGSFFYIVYLIGDLLIRNLQVESRTPTILAAMLLTLAVHPAQRKLTELIERRFYPARFQLQNMLTDLTGKLSSIPDRENLWRQISTRLRHAVGVDRVLPLLRSQDDEFKVFQGEISPFSMKDDLIQRLDSARKPILLDEAMASMLIPFTDRQIDWISKNKVNLLLPMFVRGRLVGIVALGRTTRGNDYTPEIVDSLHTVIQQVALSADNLRLLEDNIEKKRLEDELNLARSIQKGFLPQNIPDTRGLLIGAQSRFSLEVAGDYFDVIRLPDGRTVIALGDVSGKGAGAALIMANLQASLRALIKVNADLADLVGSVNDIIHQNTPVEEYITFVIGIFDYKQQTLTYINAGHNPPIVFRESAEMIELDVGGVVLGVIPGFEYEVGTIQLQDDDRIFLYTDGISEAMNPSGEEFGEERIFKFITERNDTPCPELVQNLEDEALKFHGKSNLDDDCTMILARVKSDANQHESGKTLNASVEKV
ncbi:MAG TPA: hypothetical protein ENH10_08595 [Bacteroidetes bacterium]|nr:hypothetical protein [Bacteroidota bacterium]HEX05194.1 hypothetical protein [Bacteroidota bacterium]